MLDLDADSEWYSLTRELHVADIKAQKTWKCLLELYGESSRYYHTMEHIQNLLHNLRTYSAQPSAASRLAAFFHDAVYDTTRSDNEKCSAELAVNFLRDSIEKPLVDQIVLSVTRLILATEKHIVDDREPECAIFLDCDLLILASSETDYFRYSDAIRKEYSQFDDAQYNSGRAKVLSSFLQRPRIFFTERIRTLHEQQARDNIMKELTMLKAVKADEDCN